MTPARDFDYTIVGGGLQGCLLAHALAHHRPTARVLLVERADKLCGNHTWSFHVSDIPVETQRWLDPLISHRWPGYAVRFPGHARRVALPYATVTSDAMRDATQSLSDERSSAPGCVPLTILTGESCEIRSETLVALEDGTNLRTGVAIDCRGQAAPASSLRGVGFQTFIGHEYETSRDWPASEPTLMDVPADQSDGFEFLYELPLGKRRVLLEYTRFSEEPSCDGNRASRAIAERLRTAGVGAAELVRTEGGCLPMPYAKPAHKDRLAVAGDYAGGWYHTATGYSMPLATRFAETVARSRPAEIADELAKVASRESLRRGFARLLNRLLFCLVTAEHRWKIFRRFYRVLPEERIARFYGHRFNVADAARIVLGRPPSGLAPHRFAKSLVCRTTPALP